MKNSFNISRLTITGKMKVQENLFVPTNIGLINDENLVLFDGGSGNCNNCPAAEQRGLFNIKGTVLCHAPEMEDITGLNRKCAITMLIQQQRDMLKSAIFDFLSYLALKRKKAGLSNSLT